MFHFKPYKNFICFHQKGLFRPAQLDEINDRMNSTITSKIKIWILKHGQKVFNLICVISLIALSSPLILLNQRKYCHFFKAISD